VVGGRDLLGIDTEGLSDPYCELSVPGHKLKKTKTKTVKKVRLSPPHNTTHTHTLTHSHTQYVDSGP